jgi:hypothetical protein
MGDIGQIENDLVHSCIKLNNKNIINPDLLEKCKKIDDRKYKFMNSSEEKIFGEKRNDKHRDLNSIIRMMTEIRENSINQISLVLDRTKLSTNFSPGDKIIYTDNKKNLLELDEIVSKLILDSDTKLIDNYYNKENSNYNTLLRNYLKIDNNRLELSKIGAEYGTLNRMNEIDFNKLNNSSYINYIIIIGILLIIIIGIGVFILKFM